MLRFQGSGSGGLVLGGARRRRLLRPAAVASWPAGLRRPVSPPRAPTSRVVPATPGLALDVPRLGGGRARRRRAPTGTGSRDLVVDTCHRGRTTAAAEAMGITRPRRQLRDPLRRRAQPDPQRRARRASDQRQADRPGRDLLVQRRHRRPDGRQGLPGRAGDHQRRALDRAGRRRLPGLDDRLQRRLRGRPADHGPDEPRALHLALPARAATPPSTTPTSTCASSTTRRTGCSCAPSSAPSRSSSRSTAPRSTGGSSRRRRR